MSNKPVPVSQLKRGDYLFLQRAFVDRVVSLGRGYYVIHAHYRISGNPLRLECSRNKSFIVSDPNGKVTL